MTEPELSREMYQEQILDHSREPRNEGRIEEPDLEREGENPMCGDEITMTVNLDGERIKDIKFEGHGCAISQASASILTENLKGETEEEVREMDGEDMIDLLGIPVSASRRKCALLALRTVQAAVTDPEGEKVTTE